LAANLSYRRKPYSNVKYWGFKSASVLELCQVIYGAVNFQTIEVGNFQGFFQQSPNIFKMGRNSLGIFITFTVMSLITLSENYPQDSHRPETPITLA